MIKEEYVNAETFKLLKEAGFSTTTCVEPTQAQAMRWLREVHHINIRVNWHSKIQQWFFDMLDIANIYDYFVSEDYLPTYEAAAEAGIQAACKYMI